ncbi:MAG: SymE family type I addiction module toxin [Nitrospirota bacterium]
MKHRILTVTVKPGDNPGHPLIFLGGKWLKECGFDIGGKVLVECRRGALNIRAIRFEEEREVMTVAEHS